MEGIEPADLQSAPFDYFGTCPFLCGMHLSALPPAHKPEAGIEPRTCLHSAGHSRRLSQSRRADLHRGPFPYHGNALLAELRRRIVLRADASVGSPISDLASERRGYPGITILAIAFQNPQVWHFPNLPRSRFQDTSPLLFCASPV